MDPSKRQEMRMAIQGSAVAFSFRALLAMDALMIGSSQAIGLRNHHQTWSCTDQEQHQSAEKLLVDPENKPTLCDGLKIG
jgi:hypothetical protein